MSVISPYSITGEIVTESLEVAHPVQPPMATSTLTLNALLQGENLEEVKENAHELVRYTDQFPETLPFMHPVTEDELWSMIKLSEDISRSLDKIVTLRKPILDTSRMDASCAPSCIPERPLMKRQKRRASVELSCYACNTHRTPKWRKGSDGQRTLCNFCGLMRAKREKKREKRIATREASTRSLFTHVV